MKIIIRIIISLMLVVQVVFQVQLKAQSQKTTITNFPNPIFEHLTIADGLPENSVRCILQDHLGYMWFGTQNGLVRYNGYKMKVYQPDPDDSLSISDRQIQKIFEDKTGTMWIVTDGGLNLFNRSTETFTSYLHNPYDSTSISSNWIKTIYENKNGDLLLGTNKGLDLFNWHTKSFKHIYYMDSVYSFEIGDIIEDRMTGKLYVGSDNKILIFDTVKKILIDDNTLGVKSNLGTINSFYQAVDGTIWIGHSLGLSKLNSLNNSIQLYQPFSSRSDIMLNDFGYLVEDDHGLIWAGIRSRGSYSDYYNLIVFDEKNEKFRRYWSHPLKQGSLSHNNVYTAYRDQSGIIWVGTLYYGLNKWDRNKQRFKRFYYDPNNPTNRFEGVNTIFEDQNGIIWFGTRNGLYSFNRFSNEFQNFRYNTTVNRISVQYIYIDEDGIIWLGTLTKGLGQFDPVTSSFNFYPNDPYDAATISGDIVMSISPGKNDVLWIGTYGNGLNRFNKKTGEFTQYKLDSVGSQNTVNFIFEDREEKLWFGSNDNIGGLKKIDEMNKSFSSFVPGESIYPIYEDRKGNFWIGSYNNGIILFDREEGVSIYNINEQDGLANNQVSSILEDDSGNLWIGTGNGLSKFDPITRSIKNYLDSEEFEGNRYNRISACKTSTGEMLFGTSNGFIMFHPDSIKDDQIAPQVAISNVSLFNRPGEKLEFNGFISDLEKVELSFNENDLRFDYVGLHFSEPEKNRYKYMLENFDENWIDAGTQRNATYTNLDDGEYIFRVTACNRDGVWNEEGASLKIILPPPFWATWWAYGFYVIFLGSVLYGIRKYEMNRLNWKNQFKLDEVKLKEREDSDKMKSRFFANISHEFRTPLTLILGPLEKIKPHADGNEIIKQTGLIKRNTTRLLNLVNQLLDLSKLEAGKLTLNAAEGNIVAFVRGILMSFESMAEQKNISLKVISNRKNIQLYFDKDKMAKILTNIFSNAFKFTAEGGEISSSINQTENNSVEIKVRDSGIGISENELSKLFDRFYQVDSSHTRKHEGTGIGLALTKELVELHQGKISVLSMKADHKSADGGWTEFTIELPLARKHLRDEEIVKEKIIGDDGSLNDLLAGKAVKENLQEINEINVSSIEKLDVSENNQKIGNEDEDKTQILVVEDNADVREYIIDSLGSDFQIEEASNGEQGVKKAQKLIPDLIVSDIMMPKLDGNELTKILKNDELTSHIPIILLTAKAELESKLEGLETGADDYLSKPFDTKELLIRIKNLITIRKKLQKKFSRTNFIPTKKGKTLSNLEEMFICKVIEVIENHISEEEFSIEQFASELAMSRMQLHRKLKALTGKSASLYLRSFRLQKAKCMIEQKEGNVSEIAYSVGFSSPAYFTRCFKEEFGTSPSEITR